MSENKTAMLDNFVRLLIQQIDKYSDTSYNDEYIERLFSGFTRARNGLKRLISPEEIVKYETKAEELRTLYQTKKEELALLRV